MHGANLRANTSFNSTRYIRNVCVFLTHLRALERLSTPHGTLGTVARAALCRILRELLSTPHGTLGTGTSVYSGVLSEVFPAFNSTRYIRNQVSCEGGENHQRDFQLHTVHQEQGERAFPQQTCPPFNSTRYIRNEEVYLKRFFNLNAFQLHTVHQEQGDSLHGCTYCERPFNSTRYIRNHYFDLNISVFLQYSFNSTRYIRNMKIVDE